MITLLLILTGFLAIPLAALYEINNIISQHEEDIKELERQHQETMKQLKE